MKKLILIIMISLVLFACNNSTEPKQDIQQDYFDIRINTYDKLIDYSLFADTKLDSVHFYADVVIFNSKQGEILKPYRCKLEEHDNNIWYGQNILWTTESNGNVKFICWKGRLDIWRDGEKTSIPQEHKRPY